MLIVNVVGGALKLSRAHGWREKSPGVNKLPNMQEKLLWGRINRNYAYQKLKYHFIPPFSVEIVEKEAYSTKYTY